ncbi:hypothetical protein HanRHA438_Chr17g0807591 [Helianthus annuus]|nr:hypothetical protein HanHA300_Chr17g0650081 [Helianthus annuus]KAJ0447123.1 hypothetical protein HanHA89_Chr17g0701821 [Helianthus annuus]KAJ0632028.1 hypothetical protein HanLR1_Chr17g0660491 [Helianthus annuus]KAJ0635914.1 hypothetical protein HanOQP8_Chr17g0656051 [Helianthus annuus]KAJ0825839.1 hypothetical protein HanRHA438_Chr17g0807591 [Helianthus annuus]
MHPFNRGFIPPRSSADPNQSGNPTRPVAPVPTRPNPFGSGFLDYNQQSPGFMNLLNQPLSWDPNLYGWNPNQNTDGMGSAQAFGSPLHEPDVVPETQPEVPDTQPETQKGKGKAKRAHKKKVETNTRAKKNVITWEPEEEYALTRAFIDVSEDPVICMFFFSVFKFIFCFLIYVLFFFIFCFIFIFCFLFIFCFVLFSVFYLFSVFFIFCCKFIFCFLLIFSFYFLKFCTNILFCFVFFFFLANNQSKTVFWNRIRELFFDLMGRGEEYRLPDSISGKWTDINRKCTNFQTVYQRLFSGWKSGSSDEDITQQALVEYTEANGHFPYMRCWQILRHSPKWAIVSTLVVVREIHGHQRGPKQTSRVNPKRQPPTLETPT